MIIQAFNDIKRKPLPEREGIAGFDDLRTIAALQVGTGNRAFKADQSGIWLGANKWVDAPFRVAMDGTVVVGSGYSKLTVFKQDAVPTSISTGDLWFDTNDNNKLYRAGSVGADEITAGEWELVGTSTVVFAQDAIPTSINIGDLWFDTNDDNKPYIAESVGADEITGGEWVLIDDQRAADALLKAGASQTLTGDIEIGEGNVKIDGANKRILITEY